MNSSQSVSTEKPSLDLLFTDILWVKNAWSEKKRFCARKLYLKLYVTKHDATGLLWTKLKPKYGLVVFFILKCPWNHLDLLRGQDTSPNINSLWCHTDRNSCVRFFTRIIRWPACEAWENKAKLQLFMCAENHSRQVQLSGCRPKNCLCAQLKFCPLETHCWTFNFCWKLCDLEQKTKIVKGWVHLLSSPASATVIVTSSTK